MNTVVGNDVWFGGNVTVMPGVRIGHGAIVSTGAVVNARRPGLRNCRRQPRPTEIKRRFSAEDIEKLVRIAWWDWPIEKITRHVRVISDGSVAELEAVE